MATNHMDSYRQWIRYLERQLELTGQWQRVDRRLYDLTKPEGKRTLCRVPSGAKTPEERQEITRAHMIDSLAWSFEELIEGKPIYAFRGLVQASGYAGQCGHSSVTSDAFGTLKNAIEDHISRGE